MSIFNKLKKKKKEETKQQHKLELDLKLETIQNTTTILLASAIETFGFGHDRLMRLYNKMQTQMQCLYSHKVELGEILELLVSEANLDISRVSHTDNKRATLIVDNTIDEVNACFLISLMDEFGYKTKPLNRVYDTALVLSYMINQREVTLSDLRCKLAKKGFGISD